MYAVDGLTIDASRPSTDGEASAWREWCCHVHGEFRIDLDDDRYRGTVMRQRDGDYSLVQWTSDSEQLRRDRRAIRTDPRGTYSILLPLRGSLFVGVDSPDIALGPGQFALIPSDDPFLVAHHDQTSAVVFVMPAARVEDRLAVDAVPPGHLTASTGLARVVSDLLVSLSRHAEELTASEFSAACDRAADLMCLAASGAAVSPETLGPAAIVDGVRRHVRKHATDPDLTVTAIAAELGWSVRHIQASLSVQGLTTSEFIRAERLDLARVRLGDPALGHRSVDWIGRSVGYGSASGFSKAYRRRFGVAPRDARR